MSKIITDLNCRVCLQNEELMVHIYEEVEDFQSDLSTLLEQCGGIKVDQSDCYPKYLCKECTSELLVAAKFREKCERTQQVLEYLELESTEGTVVDEQKSVDIENVEETVKPIPMPLGEDELLHINKTEMRQEFLDAVVEECEKEVKNVVVEEVPQKFKYSVEEDIKEAIAQTQDDSEHPNELIVFGIDDAVDTTLEPEAEVYVYAEEHEDDAENIQLTHFGENENEYQISVVDAVQLDEQQQQQLEENHMDDDGIYSIVTDFSGPLPPSAAQSFVCDICGALFLQPFNLKRHMKRLHLPLQDFTCQKCGHCFSQETLYAQHCSSCNYQSVVGASRKRKSKANDTKLPASVSTIKRPNVATSAELLKCAYCDKLFKSAFAYDMHLRTHTGERPFSCEHCPKTFKIQAHLNTHLKRHAGLPDFACSVCGKTFYESSNLTVHMRTHTGERPHACSICSKRFARVFLLQLHMRTHTGEKPYKCDECERSFTQACDLKNHIRTHTGERGFQCPLCPKSFIKRHPMLQHLKKHSSLGLVVDLPQEIPQAEQTISIPCDAFDIEQLDLVEEV